MEHVKYQAICTDLDQTLLMPDKSLSPKTIYVMKELIERGVEFVPTTGRAFASIPECILDFPGIRYAIVSNGAAIYDIKSMETIMQLCLAPSFAGQLFHFLKEKGEAVTYECFIKGQPYTSEKYFEDPANFGIVSKYEYDYVRSTRIPVKDIELFTLEHAGELDALDIIILPEEKSRVAKMIEQQFDDIYLTTSVDHLIEISHKNSGKHNAMAYLMNYLKIPMDQVIAFGDGNNDAQMIEKAGLGLAVGNACDACKEAADHIIGDSDQEAVAGFLEQLYHVTF